MFCMKCGAQLPDDAQFCKKCGCPVAGGQKAPPTPQPTPQPAPQPTPQPTPQPNPQPTPQPTPQPGPVWQPMPVNRRPKWVIPAVVGSVVALLAVIILALIRLGGGDQKPPVSPASSAARESSSPSVSGGFQHYENGTARFAVDYPADFTYSEPNTNNVLFGLDDACRVAVEYAFITTKNCFIYSAEDFAEQLEDDPSLLASWVGAEGVEAAGTSEEKIAGKDCYLFNWELEQNGSSYEGGLYVFDSEGEFGCYTLLWMLEKDMPDREQRMEQVEQMIQSFEITGPYQAEGYTLYSSDSPDHLEFILRDEAVQGEVELGYENEVLSNYVRIHAAEQGQSTVSMYQEKYSHASANADSDNFSRTMNTSLNTYLKSSDCKNAKVVSELSRLDIGRYPFVQVGMEFTYVGYGMNQDETCYKIFFPYGNSYWIAELRSVGENLEQTSAVLSDFLMSLRIEESGIESGEDAYGSLSEAISSAQGSSAQGSNSQGGAAGQTSDKNQMVEEILSKLENSGDFLAPGKSYEPLASVTDIDGNGVNEMVLLYKTKDYKVRYQVWSLFADGYDLLKEDELYAEVGGNSGSIDLALDENNIPYLILETRSPQGDRFNDTYTYIPWNHEQTGFNDTEKVVLEGSGVYGEEENGKYTLAGGKVDKDIFDDWRADFTQNWTALNLNKGPGNGGNNMSFDHLRHMDANTELNH